MRCWASLAGNYLFSLLRLIFRNESLVCKQSAAFRTLPFTPFLFLYSSPARCLYLGSFFRAWWLKLPGYITKKRVRRCLEERCFDLKKWWREQVRGRRCESMLPADQGNEGVQCTVHYTWCEEAYSSNWGIQSECVCTCVMLRQGEEKKIVNTGWRGTIRW